MKKPPFIQRISSRISAKVRDKGEDVAFGYCIAVISQHPFLLDSLSKLCSSSFAEKILNYFKEKEMKIYKAQMDSEEKRQPIIQVQKSASDAHANQLKNSAEQARSIGQIIVFIASLSPEDRKIAGNSSEIKLAMEMRKNSVKSTAMKTELGCSTTELNRWSTDGRLPVLFRRRMQSSFGSCDVRFWHQSTLDHGKVMVDVWRSEDVQDKASRRASNAKKSK